MKKYKISLLVVAVFMFSLFSSTAFAVPDDSIVSQHIKEADGTTGQDTNTGSGIKTGHIQDGAVTPAKIGFYSNVIIVAPSGGDFTSPVDAMNAITDASASNPYLIKIMPGVYEVPDNTMRAKSYVDIEGSGAAVTTIRSYNSCCQAHAGTIYYYNIQHSELRDITIEAEGQYNWATAKPITVSGGNPHFKDVRTVSKNGNNFGFYLSGINARPVLNRVEINLEGPFSVNQGIVANQGVPEVVLNDVTINFLTTGTMQEYGSRGLDLKDSSATVKNLRITGPYLNSGYFGIWIENQGSYVNTSFLRIYDSIIPGKSMINIYGSSVVYGSNLELGTTAYIGTDAGGTFKCVNCFDTNLTPIPNQ